MHYSLGNMDRARGSRAAVILWTLTLGSIACQERGAREQYSADANCPIDKIHIDELGEDRFLATGCNAAVVYHCVRAGCTQKETIGEPDEPATDGEHRTASKGASKAKAKPKPKTIVKMEIPLDEHGKLLLSAVPQDRAGKIQLRLLRIEREGETAQCDLGIMLDGQKINVPVTKKARQHLGSMLTVELPSAMLQDLGVARQFALKACDHRWILGSAEIAKIHQFVEVCEQENTWAGESADRSTGGLVAPASGWPKWTVAAQAPAAFTAGAELDGNSLFKLLAPSVFQIEALAGDSVRLGSAVAVSPTEILTNCHVVAGSRKIIVRQQKKEWVAALLRSEPRSDRCVLQVNDVKFAPVRGVRHYSDLKVGEALYTLGAPSGLELSISNGILSGLREEDGRRYVQTTAPISPGSSGGGLFDRRGNLVGITTGVLVGKQNVNQALNFAIPADDYWSTALP